MFRLKILFRSQAALVKNRLNLFLFCLALGVASLFAVAVVEWRSLSAQTLHCSANYTIDETLSTGARWQMCWEERLREGVIFYDVYYTPRGGTPRLVLAKAHLAQIHVPYDDNGARFHDSTDSGLGAQYLTKLTAADCPNGQLRSSNNGSVLCIQIIPRGYAFKYTTAGIDAMSQGYSINIFSISHIGEYNYIAQWQFADDGSIAPSVGATGKLQRLGTYVSAQHGWPLRTTDQGVVRGLGHNHNYYWKLDFDIDGAANDQVEEFNFLPVNNNQERELQLTQLLVESARSTDPGLQRFWRVRDKVSVNSDGHALSYEIEPISSGNRYYGPDYEPFTANDFYVTRQNSCEIFASHNPTIPTPCGENVADYVNSESVDGQDLVVWFGVNFHHLPRDEDEMYMGTHWNGFIIAPRDWNATNPLDSAATIAVTPSATVPVTQTTTPSPTPTATAIESPTSTSTSTGTVTETPSATASNTATSTVTFTPTQGEGQNQPPTNTPEFVNTATATSPATPTPTSSPSATAAEATATASLIPTFTPVRTATLSPQPTELSEYIYLPLVNR